MAAQVITCPSCNARYQTTAEAGRKLQCPGCGALLVVPAEPGRQDRAEKVLGSPSTSRRGKGSSLDPKLKPFLKRLGFGVGIICALIVLLGIVGLFSEAVAMGAVILGIVAMVGLALGGKIWLIVIGFNESTKLGLAAIFVPLFWIYFLTNRIGRSQLAFAVTVSSLMPALVSLALIGVLEPRHAPAGRSAARENRMASKADQFTATVLRNEAKTPPAGEPREVTFSCIKKIEDPAKFVAEGNRGLGQFAGYVRGSLTVGQEKRTITFRHRGSDQLQSQYRLYLCAKTGILVRPQPISGEP